MFWSFAHAQVAATAAPVAEQPNMLMTAVPFIFMIAVFYFLVARPQAKRQRETQTFLSGLKNGDEVLTTGGILGRIEGLTEQFVTLEISPNVRIKVLRSAVGGSARPTDAKKGN